MGVMEAVRAALSVTELGVPSPTPLVRSERIEQLITESVAERYESFTVADALTISSVRRAVDLIVSIGSTFVPNVYRDGIIIEAPSIITKPDPYRSRYDFTALTLRSLVESGNAYWRREDGWAVVLDPADVACDWSSPAKLEGEYEVNGVPVTSGSIEHLRIGQRPGVLKGRSPLQDGLEDLAIIKAQESFASVFFRSNGTPHTVLSTDQELTSEEAKAYRDAYVTARGESGVAAMGKGLSAAFPDTDPDKSQLVESRDYGNTTVSRLFGIPAPLLQVSLAGANLYYSNQSAVVSAFARQTLIPLYMAPVEVALGDMTPPGDTVRFSVMELQRVDVADRVNIYEQLMNMGVVSKEQVAHALGFDPAKAPEPSLSPAPKVAQ